MPILSESNPWVFHCRCWSCGNNFCGLCREVLRKGKAGTHFSPSGCKQHTYD